MRFRKLALALVSIALPSIGFSQQTSTSGDYFRDLGFVVAQVKSVGWTVEICGSEFPAVKNSLDTEYERWKAKYATFLKEVDAHFSRLEANWRSLPPHLSKDALTQEEIGIRVDAHKEVLRDELAKLNPEDFQKLCLSFHQLLGSPRMNLELQLIGRVVTIRKGPFVP